MDTRLKERLVGAAALVLIVVLVVPELLTGPKRAEAPAPAEAIAPVHTVVIDLAASGHASLDRPAADAPDAKPMDAPAVRIAPPVPGASSTPVVAASPSAAVPAETAATPAAAPPPAPATTQALPAPSVAPTPTPTVTAKPDRVPTATAPATAGRPVAVEPAPKLAAKPVTRPTGEAWVVQLGSFASRENAEKLAVTLRAKGYRAFVSEFHGSSRTLYRVRVGPEQDRARAEAIAARLARDGHKGSVAPR